ncbi:MAG: HAD hydrolase family protein [Chloroflexi bacterium]|nr:HAD hydrolase family protein [Chloroflexota bacterium]
MVDRSQVLAVVLATGRQPASSEDVLQSLAGYPLIAYSIAAGRQAESIGRVIVATFSDRVALIARGYGADAALLLPPDLEDKDLRLWILGRLAAEQGEPPQVVVWLDPWSPLRPLDCVDRAVEMLMSAPETQRVVGLSSCGRETSMLWTEGDVGALKPLAEDSAPAGSEVYRETGQVEAVRFAETLPSASHLANKTLPLFLEPSFQADVRHSLEWEWAGWLLQRHGAELVRAGRKRRPLPENTALLVMDFDGVLTDNRVWVSQDGAEQVAAYRSDSLGLTYLRRAGIEAMVLSMEENPVVAARCRKMKVPYLQGIEDKAGVLVHYLSERGINPAQVVYLGNDLNDVPCFSLVGCAAVVADAQPGALQEADLVLTHRGGYGAVRELCDLLIERKNQRQSQIR